MSTNHIVLLSVPLTECSLYRNVDDYMIAKLHTGISATSYIFREFEGRGT